MKPTKTLNIIFFGPQGSGKGTQAKLLAARLGLRHLSSGEALRQTAKQKTPLGRYLARQLPTGTLTPVPKLLRVFETHIRRIPVTQGIIFDGFARQISETRIFLRRLKAIGRNLDLAIMIGIVSSETIREIEKKSFRRLVGYRPLAERINFLQDSLQVRESVVFSESYHMASELAFYLPGNPQTYTINLGARKKFQFYLKKLMAKQ